MTWFRVGGAGIPASLRNGMNAVLNKKFGTSGQNYPPNGWPNNVNLLGALSENTASGAIANITDGADGVPVKNWLVTLPASLDGYTEVNGYKGGKNLLQNKTYQRNANTLRLGTDTLDGRLSLKSGTYTLSITSDVEIGNLVYTIGGTSTNITFTSSGTRYYGSFTLSADTDDIFLHVYKSGGITAENVSDFMLEVGSAPTQYTAYEAPTQYTAQLGRTIYGGTADIVTGEGEDENGNAFTFTPITPTPDTELGVNNFWADEGDSAVTYRSSGTVTPVPIQPTLISKSITENGTYSAEDDDADGYSSVTVNVPSETELDFTGITTSYNMNGVDYNANGAVFNSTSDYIALPFVKGSVEIEIDVAAMTLNTDQHRRFLSSDISNGFLYRRDGGVWSFYNGSWFNSEISDGSFFANSTVKIVVDSNNYWHIYKDGVLVFEPQGALALKNVCIGSTSASINNATITAIRIKPYTPTPSLLSMSSAPVSQEESEEGENDER